MNKHRNLSNPLLHEPKDHKPTIARKHKQKYQIKDCCDPLARKRIFGQTSEVGMCAILISEMHFPDYYYLDLGEGEKEEHSMQQKHTKCSKPKMPKKASQQKQARISYYSYSTYFIRPQPQHGQQAVVRFMHLSISHLLCVLEHKMDSSFGIF